MQTLQGLEFAGPPDEPRDDHGRWTDGGSGDAQAVREAATSRIAELLGNEYNEPKIDLDTVAPAVADQIASSVAKAVAEFPSLLPYGLRGVIVDGTGRNLGEFDIANKVVTLSERDFGPLQPGHAETDKLVDHRNGVLQDALNPPGSFHPLDDLQSTVDHEIGHAVWMLAQAGAGQVNSTQSATPTFYSDKSFTYHLFGVDPWKDDEKLPIRSITRDLRDMGSAYGAKKMTETDRAYGSGASLGSRHDLSEGFSDWFSARQRGGEIAARLAERTSPALQSAFDQTLAYARQAVIARRP